jgi:protein-tyrosine sulfotransferase
MKPHDLKRYLEYGFEAHSFAPAFVGGSVTDEALEAARKIRGTGRRPAIVIHGVMPRCGTVYVGELLRLHPDLCAYPRQLWELPFLPLAGDLQALQRTFFRVYEQNRGKIGQDDFLPLFGAALVGYLHTAVPAQQRILLKVPSVQYLSQFFDVFAHEHLLVLVRDGRDLVESTLRTWPRLQFWQVCMRWNRAARMVLAVHEHLANAKPTGYWLARYEDALDAPEAFVHEACRRFGLGEERYPFDQISGIPVQGSSFLAKGGKVSWVPVQRTQDFRPLGYWRKWSALRKWLFKRLAGQSLLALGYCEDLTW